MKEKKWAVWSLSEGDIELAVERRGAAEDLTEDVKEMIALRFQKWVEDVLSLSDWDVALSDIISDVAGDCEAAK